MDLIACDMCGEPWCVRHDKHYADCSCPGMDELAKIEEGESMTPEQESHLTSITEWFREEVDEKYRQGQKEHGGSMWEKPGMLRSAIEEALDQVTYLKTLHDQIADKDPKLLKFLMNEDK